ncbi:MAG: nuclear transport factor 2 family protein [Nitrososphaeraceae archaeon]
MYQLEVQINNLRINQLSKETFEWYISYLNTVDIKDLKSYSTYLSDNCIMQINNNQPTEGKDSILKDLSSFWKSFDKVTHDLLNIYGNDYSFVLEALNHFIKNNGKHITIRAVAFTDRNNEGLVSSVRLYADLSPLFSND